MDAADTSIFADEAADSAGVNQEDQVMGKKQLEIKGTERKGHKDIDEAAEKYVEIRDERMELTRQEVAARAVLVDAMKKHKQESYENDDLIVTFEADVKEKVKVKRRGDDADEAAE